MLPAKNKYKQLGQNIKANRVSYLMMLPYLIFFVLFTILPVIVSIVLSFTDYDMVQTPVFVGLENYFQIFLNDEYFIVSLKNTLIFAIILGPASYVICFLVAWLINDLKPLARAFVTALFYIPTIVGAAGWGVWRLIFSSDQYGLINGFLMKLGLVNEPIGWLTDEAYILPVLIVVSLWMSMGISFLTFIAGFQNVDKTLYEAGMMDGIKNRFQELWYITIPSMANQMVFGAVMQIVNCFAVGEVSAVLAGLPSTGYAGETIVTHIMDYGNLRFEFGYACAMGVVLVLMMQYSKKLATSLIGKMGH
ncbi:MAG: sugar ABC transporter permease [Oscillospiraceae bacterium]|nr:sugar ABC transporter permease [Oscillospiraceae bacterium]